MINWRYCGQVDANSIGQSLTIRGWVKTIRKLGSLIFLDVIDRYGRITINEGFHMISTGMPAKSYMPSNAEMKIFIL